MVSQHHLQKSIELEWDIYPLRELNFCRRLFAQPTLVVVSVTQVDRVPSPKVRSTQPSVSGNSHSLQLSDCCTPAQRPESTVRTHSNLLTATVFAGMTISNHSHPQQLFMLHPSVTPALDSLVDGLNVASATKDVFAVLLGTSDGIALAHSFGTGLETSPQLRSGLSEEMLSKIERTWATLPSDSLQGAGHYLRPLGLGGIKTATVFFDNVVLTHVQYSPLVRVEYNLLHPMCVCLKNFTDSATCLCL